MDEVAGWEWPWTTGLPALSAPPATHEEVEVLMMADHVSAHGNGAAPHQEQQEAPAPPSGRAPAPPYTSDEPFDPLRDLLLAQKTRPSHLRDISLRALTPFQRALLVIDGTVTKFIEAYKMEPVEVVRLSQESRQLPTAHAWLEVDEGTVVIARRVLLCGRDSQTMYAYATSLIVLERLPAQAREKLDQKGESLGRILLTERMETYRDILWYGWEHLADRPAELRDLTIDRFLSRTYRIITGDQPVMLINEKFPFAQNA